MKKIIILLTVLFVQRSFSKEHVSPRKFYSDDYSCSKHYKVLYKPLLKTLGIQHTMACLFEEKDPGTGWDIYSLKIFFNDQGYKKQGEVFINFSCTRPSGRNPALKNFKEVVSFLRRFNIWPTLQILNSSGPPDFCHPKAMSKLKVSWDESPG